MLIAQIADEGFNHAVQALSDAMSGGDLVLAIVAGILVVGVVVLKFLDKKVPFLDGLIDVAIAVAKKFSKKSVPPETKPGVSGTVKVTKDE